MQLKRSVCWGWGGALGLSIQSLVWSTNPTKPVFEDGEAQVVEEFQKDWIQHDLWVETEFDSDGDGKRDRMHVSVTRQQQTDTENLKVPVIYQSSPYYSGTGSNDRKYFWSPLQQLGDKPPKHDHPPEIDQQSLRPVLSREHLKEWLPRGFAVVHSSSPGTGLSQGCPTVGGDNESLAPKAVIDWLNGRANGYASIDGDEKVFANWCTGKVAMTGTSYNGTLALAAATTGVDGLEAIIPVAPNTSYYHYYRSHGLIRHPGGYMGEDIDVLYDFINSGNPEKRDYCNCNIRDKEMMEGFDRVTGDYNDFWAGRDYLHKLEKMKAPMLMAHAFNDWNVMPEHSIRIYEAVKENGVLTQLYMHQGGHGGSPPTKLMNRWFTRFLYGIQNDLEKSEPVWIVREGDERTKPTAYDNYPLPASKLVRLFPTQGGIKQGKLVPEISPDGAARVESIVDNYSFAGPALAKAEWSNHRLIYATEELTSDVHLSGTPRVTVRLACSKPAACLSVWLVSLPWTDSKKLTDDIITRGWADPQNHRDIRSQEPLKTGEFRDVSFNLQPEDQIIRAGEKIGLMIFSSDRDFTLWQEPGTELQIDLQGTRLELPIVGGSEKLRESLGSIRP